MKIEDRRGSNMVSIKKQNRLKIEEFFKGKETININECAKSIGLSPRTVRNHYKEMKSDG